MSPAQFTPGLVRPRRIISRPSGRWQSCAERGELTEDEVFEFAHSLKFNETAVALSLLCPLPIDIVERALIEKDREPVLIMAKSLEFSCADYDGAPVPGGAQLPNHVGRSRAVEPGFPSPECQNVPGGHGCVSITKGGGQQRTISAIANAPLDTDRISLLEARVHRAYELMRAREAYISWFEQCLLHSERSGR